MSENNKTKWVKKTVSDNKYLATMLEFGSSNYERHANWFLRHRDIGIKYQAIILTVEFSILGISFQLDAVYPKYLVCSGLYMLGIFSVILAYTSCRSCTKSFIASLENALLVTKVAWAMGLADRVAVKEIPESNPPVSEDSMLYINRYWKDSCIHQTKNDKKEITTTKQFVDVHIKDKDTTLFLGALMIKLFCAGAIITAVAGSIVIYISKSNGLVYLSQGGGF